MSETPLDHLARAAARPETVAAVAALLSEYWDPASEFPAPNGTLEPAAHARATLAILAAGGRQSELVSYFRRAEEEVLGLPRSNGGLRWALAARILDVALGRKT